MTSKRFDLNSDRWKIAVALGIVILILIVLAIIIVVIWRKRSKKFILSSFIIRVKGFLELKQIKALRRLGKSATKIRYCLILTIENAAPDNIDQSVISDSEGSKKLQFQLPPQGQQVQNNQEDQEIQPLKQENVAPENIEINVKPHSQRSLQFNIQSPPQGQLARQNQSFNTNEDTAVRTEETKKYNNIIKTEYKLIDTDIQQEQQKNDQCVIDIGDIIYFEKQDILKEQIQLNQQNCIFSHQENATVNQIINQRFYLPSFKQRKVEDEYLKKFIREFYDIQQFYEEYNLDGSQKELLNNQILKFVPIRGDGNCMFTSIGFQYLYYNIIDEGRYQRLLKLIDQTDFKQKFENQQVDSEEEQQLFREEFKDQLNYFTQFTNQDQLLQQITYSINNHDGPLYGLMVIFLRNYFRKILQDFQDNDELNWLIQDPQQINELITWEFMYNEADIALKLFSQKEKILIKCFKKMNIGEKIVDISYYHDDDQKEFPYKIGLAFQPGHYNAILVKN